MTAFFPIEGLPGVHWFLGVSVDKATAYAPLTDVQENGESRQIAEQAETEVQATTSAVEAGKEFAVVANEVKSLATQTARATEYQIMAAQPA